MPQAPIQLVDLPFPMGGVHESSGIAEQPPGTSPEALNVRGYDLLARRDRGCQRVGLLKAVASNQTGEGIDLMCVGYVGKVQWAVGSGNGSGSGYTVNAGFKLERHSATAVVTAQSVDGGNPGSLTAGNTGNSFFHPANASPNPSSLGLGLYSYTLGTTAFDDNGTAGDGAADRTMTLTGMAFGTVVLKQAGELAYTEAFAYTDGILTAVDSGRWTVTAGGLVGNAPLVPSVLSASMRFPNSGIRRVRKSVNDGGADYPDGTIINVATQVPFGQTRAANPTKSLAYFSDQTDDLQTAKAYSLLIDAVWPTFTTGFQLPGTGYYLRLKFKLDATAVAYLTGTLKPLYESVDATFGFTQISIFRFLVGGTHLAELDIRYDSFAAGWYFRTWAGVSVSAWTAASSLLVNGAENVFEIIKNGAGTTWKLNGTTISTDVITAPTTVSLEIQVNYQNGTGGYAGTNFPTGQHYVYPLIVTEVYDAGDKPASLL